MHEVQFRGGSLNGLRLFYIGKIPYRTLGPERDTSTFKAYPALKEPAGIPGPAAWTDR